MRLILALMVSGCTTINSPTTFTGACPVGDIKCQRNRDAETLHYIGQTEAALEMICPEIVDQYGVVCAVY